MAGLLLSISMPCAPSRVRYQQQPPRGAATVDESESVSEQRLNANDFRMILAEDDTEKLGGYQEKKCSRCRDQGLFIVHQKRMSRISTHGGRMLLPTL
jgi:hypothetical protein